MKYLPEPPWWLNRTIKCSVCKGLTVFDSPLDAQEIEFSGTARDMYGQQLTVVCAGCGTELTARQFSDNQWVAARSRGSREGGNDA